MFSGIIFEIKKILKNRFLFGLALFFLAADWYILSDTYFGIGILSDGEKVIYENVRGPVTEETCNFVIDNYKKIQKVVESGEYSVKEGQKGTFTGYVMGDYNVFLSLYNEFKDIFAYKEYTKYICDKAKENVRMFADNNIYGAKKYSLIYRAYSGRKIDSYYNGEVIQGYLSYDYSTLFMFLILIVGIGNNLFLDKENNMYGILRTLPYGKVKMLFQKICAFSIYSMVIVIVFSVWDILIIQFQYGFIDNWGACVYSMSEYRDTPLNCTVGGFFLMWLAYRFVAILLFSLITYVVYTMFKKEIYTIVYTIVVYLSAVVACIYMKAYVNPIAMFNLQELVKSCQIVNIAGTPVFYHEIVLMTAISIIILLIIYLIIMSINGKILRGERKS